MEGLKYKGVEISQKNEGNRKKHLKLREEFWEF